MVYNINFKNTGFKKFAAVFIFIFILSLFYGNFVFSENGSAPVTQDINLGHAFGAVLQKAAGQAGYIEQVSNVGEIIGLILQIALSFLGVIFLVLMVYGGYNWMTALGNEEQVKKAQEAITAAVIGLVIVILAYAISWFVIFKLGGATLGGQKSGKTTTPSAALAQGTPVSPWDETRL